MNEKMMMKKRNGVVERRAFRKVRPTFLSLFLLLPRPVRLTNDFPEQTSRHFQTRRLPLSPRRAFVNQMISPSPPRNNDSVFKTQRLHDSKLIHIIHIISTKIDNKLAQGESSILSIFISVIFRTRVHRRPPRSRLLPSSRQFCRRAKFLRNLYLPP